MHLFSQLFRIVSLRCVTIHLFFYMNINIKNCSLSIVLTATDQKTQKSLKRWYYTPSHRLNINVMLSNMTCLMMFADFWKSKMAEEIWHEHLTDWKDVLMQKVVTLYTCCDIACMTFQLPHITTGSFQSHRWQSTTGSVQCLQRLKERNKPSVRWKSFAIQNLVWWHFQVGWVSGLQIVFLWYNVNNSEVCMNNTVENDFFKFPTVQWLHLTGEVDNL